MSDELDQEELLTPDEVIHAGQESLDESDDGESTPPAKALVRRRDTGLLDPLERYMQETAQHRVLTPEEEHAVAVEYQKTKDPRLAYQLVTANLRLVVKIAYEFTGYTKNILDLIQEGNIGLMQAVKNYDPLRGVRLTTYARYWIRSYMIYYLLNNHRLVKLGKTQAERKLFFNLQKERARLQGMGIQPNVKMLAEKFEVPERTVIEMSQRLDRSEVSLSSPRGDSSRETLGEAIGDKDATSPEQRVSDGQIKDLLWTKIHEFGDNLEDEREQVIWRERLLTENPVTLQELGERFEVSRERVRQLEERLKKRLKTYLEEALGSDGLDLDFLADA